MNKKNLKRLQTAVDNLNESDRLVGELSRELRTLRTYYTAEKTWTANAKKEAGFDDNESFDVVWRQVLNRANSISSGETEITSKAVDWCVQKLTAELNMYLKSNLVMVVSTEKLAQIHSGVMYHIRDVLTHEIKDINHEVTPEE